MIDRSPATRIRMLRAIGRPVDAFAWRQSVERALSPSPIRISGVLPHAIVCVRSVRTSALRAEPARWRAELSRRLDVIGRGAVRPFHQSVPAGALAVVFNDEAELLACLARDWKDGAWWWAALFDEPVSPGLVRRVLIERSHAVAAACGLLQQRGILLDLVRHWDDGQCIAMRDAIARTFALPPLRAPHETTSADDLAAPHKPQSNQVQIKRSAAREVLAAQLGDTSVLTIAQRSFAVTVTLLGKAPALARIPGLIEQVCASMQPQQTPTELFDEMLTPPDVGEAPAPQRAQPLSIDATVEPPRAVAPLVDDTAVETNASSVEMRESTSMPALPLVPEIRTASDERLPIETREENHVAVDIFESQYAGAVYLINLALYLGLYGDFTMPRAVECPLPLGELLARIAERACGGAVREDDIDRLFVVLGAEKSDADDEVAKDTERLLNDVWPQLAAAAARAMQMPEDAVLRFLCETTGRIEIAPTRVDAYFALAAHSIDIRLAGLDRDPGWVPAAGRIVAFHYE